MNFFRDEKQKQVRLGLGVFILAAGVLFLYLSIVSAGWSGWISPSYNLHYELLAEGFLHGQPSLLNKPPAELVALPNPYDNQARKGMDYLWDASLYHGKYYLYWGPVPALAGLPVKILFRQPLRTELLTLISLTLTLLFEIFILWTIRRRFFPALPGWTLLLGCLALGMSNPVFWLLQRPSIYETAISSGQAFLLGGLFLTILGIARKRAHPLLLLLIGVFFAAAAGSRLSLAPLVLWCALITALWVVERSGGIRRGLRQVFWLAVPLAAAGMLMLAYNTARFDDPFEFGLRYQLTGTDMRAGQTFSLSYLAPNLRFYLFGVPNWRGKFPFLFARMGDETLRQSWNLPSAYAYHEPVTGILLTSPYLWFALPGLFEAGKSAAALWNAIRRRRKILSLDWILLLFGGCFLCAFATVMTYFYAAMRFEWDFLPCLGLLAVLGFWLSYQKWNRKPALASGLALLFGITTLLSALIGFFISFSEYHACFQRANPAGYAALQTASNQVFLSVNQRIMQIRSIIGR